MKNLSASDYGRLCTDTIMNEYTPEQLPPVQRFHYHQGVFLAGVEQIYKICGDEKYNEYIKAWVDCHIDEQGKCETCHLSEFDDMQPGNLLFRLYAETGDERYKIMLDTIIDAAQKSPKNARGGVWHKEHLKNQMWLDSMYMLGLIMTRYAVAFNEPYFHEVIYQQMKLMYENMRNPETGLLYHAWDDSKQARWADKETGCSAHHWGRAFGWYVVALAEILEITNGDIPHADEYKTVLSELLNSVIKYQSTDSGLWYQIIDKTGEKDNWYETSCSALFTYAIAKAVRIGVLSEEYIKYAQKGYKGVISKVRIDEDGLSIDDVCIGTGVGDYRFYIERPRVSHDLHGMGAFILMCSEIHRSGIV